MNLTDIYFLAWLSVDPSRLTLTQDHPDFQEYLSEEMQVVTNEVRLLMGDGVTDGEYAQRWRVRVGLTRAANYIGSHWSGRCRECHQPTNALNSATPNRTICDKCANKKRNAPSAGDLFNLMGDVFPTMTLHPGTIATWNETARAEANIWLDAILRQNPLPPTPLHVRPWSKMLGLTLHGQDLWPPIVEAEDEV